MITLHEIIDSLENGTIVSDKEGKVIDVNKKVLDDFNRNRNEIVGTDVRTILQKTGNSVIDCINNGTPLFWIPESIPPDKKFFVDIIPIYSEEETIKGALIRLHCLAQYDVPLPNPELFQRIRKQLEIVFETSSDGIWICDGDGKILALNQASERLNGVKEEDVVGRNVTIMVEKNIVDINITPDVIRTRQTISKMQYVKRTGRHLMVTGNPAFDSNGNVTLVVVNERDMTELNLLAKKLEKTQQEKKQMMNKLSSFNSMHKHDLIVMSETPQMRDTFETALKLAQHEVSNILILGETGAGKGLMCDYIQRSSPRNKEPFIKINCAALPESLLEAELFGYEKGAFTGANEKGKTGLFKAAHKGILLLDEIGDMPISIQSKLLKYLDDHEIMPLGGVTPQKIDCLILAATNQDLTKLVKAKRFRRDLFHRINNFVLRIPPLRERPDDMSLLANYYLNEYNTRYNTKKRIGIDGVKALQGYHFPGNIRELKNIVKEAVIIGNENTIDGFLLDKLSNGKPDFTDNMAKGSDGLQLSFREEMNLFEKKLLSRAALKCNSTVELAKQLNVSQATASRKMQKYGLRFRTKPLQ